MKPLVSVIIPTYHRYDTLPRAVESVLKQNYDNIEIIVVDDNDPLSEYRTETEKVMDNYISHHNVKYIKHEKNKNGSAARNTGFKNSKGDYIMFLDDDDEFLENKISSQVDCLESKDETWGFCYTGTIRKRGDEVVARTTEKQEGNILKDALARDTWVFGGSNFMVRRNVFEEVGGFDESFKRNQDEEFLVKVMKKYKLAYVDIYGLCVYLGSDNRKKTSLEDINKHYINTFKDQINQLTDTEQREVYQKLNLQLYRDYLQRKQIMKALRMIVKRDFSFVDSVSYIFYLIDRRLKKEDRCYKIKHLV